MRLYDTVRHLTSDILDFPYECKWHICGKRDLFMLSEVRKKLFYDSI